MNIIAGSKGFELIKHLIAMSQTAPRSMNSIEARLQRLETRAEENAKEILKLKSENLDLWTKVGEIRQENISLNEKMLGMETVFMEHGNDLDNRLTSLRSLVDRLSDNHDRICHLESVVNQSQQDVFEKLNALEGEISMDSTLPKEVCYAEGFAASSETVVRGSKQQGTLKMENVEKEMIMLKGIWESITQSITWIRLNTREDLMSHFYGRLDRCICASRNCGNFDEESCTLQAPVDGDMVFCVQFSQSSNGVIGMFVFGTGESAGENVFIGQTDKDNDTSSNMCILSVKKGQKLWLEAFRWAGEAQISSCNLIAWLISPSPVC